MNGAGRYSEAAALRILSLRNRSSLEKLHNSGAIPCVGHQENCSAGVDTELFFDVPFMDWLATKLVAYPAEWRNSEHLDVIFFKLCLIEWEAHRDFTSTTPKNNRAYWKNARARCDVLVRSGDAYTLAMLAPMLGKNFAECSLMARRGKLPIVRIGSAGYAVYYVSRQYGDRLADVMLNWLLPARVAIELTTSRTTVYRWIRNGKLKAFRCPDGHERVPRRALAALELSLEQERTRSIDGKPAITIDEAARRLGVFWDTVSKASESIVYTPGGSHALILVSEVEEWERRFTHLNTPFSWLEPCVIIAGRLPRTVNAKQAATLLGVSRTSIQIWSRRGLLPFFLRSFPNSDGGDVRVYVYVYLLSLKRYAGDNTITFRTAGEYMQACMKTCQII